MKRVLEYLKVNYRETIASLVMFISLIVIIFPCGQYEYNKYIDYQLNGYTMAFGLVDGDYQIVSPSVIGIIALVIALIAIVFPFLKEKIKYVLHYELVLLIACAVLFVLLPFNVNHASDYVAKNFVVLPSSFIAAGIIILGFLFLKTLIVIDYIKVKYPKKEKEDVSISSKKKVVTPIKAKSKSKK